MRVLYKARAIRAAIKNVLSDTLSDRFAVVAFIGPTPLTWIPDPKGLAVYCWPLAGGSHPAGIDALIAAGATVHFKKRLHSKLYHSSTSGTVLGSANLSANALDDGGLTETVVVLPPGTFSIEEQLAELVDAVPMGTPEFAHMFTEFRLQHVAFCQRNPTEGSGKISRLKKRTFGEWASMQDRDSWQLGLWADGGVAPADSVAEFEESTGGSFTNFRTHFNSKNLRLQTPTLDCRLRKSDAWDVIKSKPRWWYPEFQTVTRQPEWKEYFHVWLARKNIPTGCTVPFDCREERFGQALSKAVHEFGDEIDNFEGPVSDAFVAELLRHY